jgi:hypothetical protein
LRPCTEIHWFNGNAGKGPVPYETFGDEPAPDGSGWMEIWNLVFMQWERSVAPSGDAKLSPLPLPCVDTGAGLERVSSVLQGVTSNYDTDLLRGLVDEVSEISGKRYQGSQADDDVSMRVIADHARTTAFLVSEGIFPDRAGVRMSSAASCAARFVTATDSASGSRSSTSGPRGRADDGRPVPGARAAQRTRRERCPRGGRALPRDRRARTEDPRGRSRRDARCRASSDPRRNGVQALRHVRVSSRPDRGHRGRSADSASTSLATSALSSNSARAATARSSTTRRSSRTCGTMYGRRCAAGRVTGVRFVGYDREEQRGRSWPS